ncbi:ATP synthase delta chain, chloroplastic-like [Nymphaea colorata]|nr:ATP synthase delta chain, chloroplastic-like [Nymphaea colorata]
MNALQQSSLAFRLHTAALSSNAIPRAASGAAALRSSSISGISFPSLRLLRCAGRRKSGAAGATMVDTAASSYATALADVARANDTLEITSGDVEKIEKLFEDENVLEFFASPVIGLEKKQKVIDEMAAGSKLQPHTVNFLNILVEMKRVDIIREIVKEFEAVYNRLTDTELAVVTSVVKLEPHHLAQIAQTVQRLTGKKNVRIKTAIDPSLVAGFTVRYGSSGSKLIDMSVRKQLQEIAGNLDVKELVGSLKE